MATSVWTKDRSFSLQKNVVNVDGARLGEANGELSGALDANVALGSVRRHSHALAHGVAVDCGTRVAAIERNVGGSGSYYWLTKLKCRQLAKPQEQLQWRMLMCMLTIWVRTWGNALASGRGAGCDGEVVHFPICRFGNWQLHRAKNSLQRPQQKCTTDARAQSSDFRIRTMRW